MIPAPRHKSAVGHHTLSVRQTLQAVLDDDAVHLLGAAIPLPPREHGGVRRHNPGWVLILFNVMVQRCGTAVQAEAELSDPALWAAVYDTARRRYPDDPTMWPPKNEPVKRWHWAYIKKRYLKDLALIEALNDIGEQHAVDQATALGLCTDTAGGSLTHPSPNRVIQADATTITPHNKPPREDTKPNPRYHTVDAHLQRHGDAWHHGTDWILAATRGDERNRRIILGIDYLPPSGDEGQQAVRLLDRLVRRLPGTQVAVYDGKLRGVHLRTLMRDTGVLGIARQTHAPGGNAPEHPLGRVPVTGGRRTTIDIHLIWGHPHVVDHDIDGNAKPVQLDRIRILRRTSKKRHRFYGEYAVPDRFGGGHIRLRLTSDDTDEANEFNREEHLRAISRLDPDNPRTYGRRNDTEALNSLVDYYLPNGRAHSVSVAGVFIDFISFRAWRNAIAVALDGLPPPDDPNAA